MSSQNSAVRVKQRFQHRILVQESSLKVWVRVLFCLLRHQYFCTGHVKEMIFVNYWCKVLSFFSDNSNMPFNVHRRCNRNEVIWHFQLSSTKICFTKRGKSFGRAWEWCRRKGWAWQWNKKTVDSWCSMGNFTLDVTLEWSQHHYVSKPWQQRTTIISGESIHFLTVILIFWLLSAWNVLVCACRNVFRRRMTSSCSEHLCGIVPYTKTRQKVIWFNFCATEICDLFNFCSDRDDAAETNLQWIFAWSSERVEVLQCEGLSPSNHQQAFLFAYSQ